MSHNDEAGFTIAPARYAKHMTAVHCERGGDGIKTRAMRLACYFARHRWSGRERAYIMSRAAAEKFAAHFAAGFDAHTLFRELIPPQRAAS